MKKLNAKTVLSMLGMTLGLLSVFVWTGCTVSDPEIPDPSLTLDVSEVTIAPEGETVKIPIVTNSNLAAPISSHSWITAEITDDNGVLEITVGANTGNEAREGNVTVKTKTGSNDVSRTVKVKQGLQQTNFRFDQESYSIGYVPSTLQVSLFSDGKWEISQKEIPGWLEVNPTSGDGDAAISVKYRSNVSLNERTAQIMFKNTDHGGSAILRLIQAGHPKGLSDFSHLGKGYDASGRYANDIDVKASVLDCDKLYNASNIADPINTYKTEEANITGNTREEYVSNYAVSAGVSAHAFGFSASVESNFSESALSSQENCFATFRHMTKKQIIKVHEGMTPEMLKDCHSAEFDKDVTTLTTDQLVDKYGTHVIMGLSLGGVLEYSMTADASAASKSFDLSIAAKAGYEGMAYGASVSGGYDQYESLTTEEACMEEKLVCRGGDSQFASSGFGSKDTFDRWLESLNDPNKWVMIDYEGGQLVSLDQFISDPAKAAEVKTYIDDLLSIDRLPALGSRYRMMKVILYDMNLRGKYCYHGIYGGDVTVKAFLDGKQVGEAYQRVTFLPKEGDYSHANIVSTAMPSQKVNAKMNHELEIVCTGVAPGPQGEEFEFKRKLMYASSQEKWEEANGNVIIPGESFYIYDQYDPYTSKPLTDWLIEADFLLYWNK